MRLTEVQVRNFKSIDDSGLVSIDPEVTVLVGQNEAGKTAFLQALEKARPIRENVQFNITEDYPRKELNEYQRKHETNPADTVFLTYELDASEQETVNQEMGGEVLTSTRLTLTYKYNGDVTVGIETDEPTLVRELTKRAKLSREILKSVSNSSSLRDLIKSLEASDLNSEGQTFLSELKGNFENSLKSKWANVVSHKVWYYMLNNPPEFLYFGDYQLLPGKINLPTLQRRSNQDQLTEQDQTVLRLLGMADVTLEDLLATTSYEPAKARLEGLSNSITDQIFKYWTQNQDLDVEFDIRTDPADPEPPYNSGPNLYIRIRNRRHRVTVPFSQRSKGFIWFFSFLAWFDSVRAEGVDAPIILLLDEPGLSLHAMAQADLLRYIDDLSKRHQVLYTTHSPFMVHGDRLHQVRLVEDRLREGTVVSDNISGSDPKTIFPLQAALGYTIAQNLFISRRNLLVEGPGDLIYLRFMSAQLEASSRVGLRDDITIVPAGGLDKVATFIALLRGNELDIVVVHDLASKPDARLESMVREKVIRDRQVLNYGMFRSTTSAAKSGKVPATDIEDLFSPDLYLQIFSRAFAKQLGGLQITEADLPKGDRILERLERYLASNNISLRPSGGFNHYSPAGFLASNPIQVDSATLDRFEALFRSVNSQFTT